ncbi:RsmB/NOP family class I SAM-dependent RNA methyltransferase [Opitutus sp. ER46]|uniref:RsmB/NOP family class I SAM-dependent RNA methyltransferase n=1 Tax=Opitutus sp. ER46 TaxID=2161864 RepID=UPI000D2F5A20|nr:RsmB/NOP family class I SAM-dependent RNA methyltransferase [Opitutus sp. ER46]PTY00493.1 RNA methyltransferase [Opitutus sp. ER46]
MLESATLNHAARVLASIDRDLPADGALRRYLYGAKHLGPREKRAVSRAVFAYFRWMQWLDPKASYQKQVEQAWAMQERFNADEKSVKAEALKVRAVPEWVAAEMDLPADYLRQLQHEPALWLRARPGRAAKLAQVLGDCVHSDRAPDAMRYTGPHDLFLTPAFHEGTFEIQDLASQLVSLACAPAAGQTWWDACAGEGGKLLHLADLMGNKGVIWASDRNERRLAVLKRRAARAQVFNYRAALWDGGAKLPTKTKFDGILVDAPCSGVGTWQRNPHARWTVGPEDVRELAATQLALLNHVVPALRPKGRLVYSVCTLTRSETTAVVAAFQSAHPELQPDPLFGAAPELTLWPHELNANGMFIAAWRKPE